VFLHLPQLHAAALRADPMVGNPRHIILDCIGGVCRAWEAPPHAATDDPLRCNRRSVVRALELLTPR
jgi:hypothetical protein